MYIDETLYSSRPDDARLAKELRCYDFLDKLGISYLRVDHEFADTIEQCHEVEKVLGCSICKNLLLTNRQMTEVYLLLLPGDKPFKTKYLSRQIGTARLSFAAPEQMLEYLDITPGSLSVLGLINDSTGQVHLLIDDDLLPEEYLGCHPCINSSSLRLKTDDVIRKIIPATGHDITYVSLPWNMDE